MTANDKLRAATLGRITGPRQPTKYPATKDARGLPAACPGLSDHGLSAKPKRERQREIMDICTSTDLIPYERQTKIPKTNDGLSGDRHHTPGRRQRVRTFNPEPKNQGHVRIPFGGPWSGRRKVYGDGGPYWIYHLVYHLKV
jgi:hypothetical protein